MKHFVAAGILPITPGVDEEALDERSLGLRLSLQLALCPILETRLQLAIAPARLIVLKLMVHDAFQELTVEERLESIERHDITARREALKLLTEISRPHLPLPRSLVTPSWLRGKFPATAGSMKMDDQEHQLGFELGGGNAPTSGQPDLHEIREDLEAILDEARHASADGPWDIQALRYKRIVFLQLAKLLPNDEGEQLSFDFLSELERIETLLAA